MSEKFTATAKAKINAPKEKVWEALTSPEIIKKYFFGTNAVSDWKVGSPLIFEGEWEGKSYRDKGIILSSNKPNHFKYTYWSSMSGMKDAPENYVNIAYDLKDEDGGTELTITQTNVPSEEMRKHAEANWEKVLEGLKKVVEG